MDVMFSFGFLGSEVGSERETVRFWGGCSIALGIALLGALAVRSRSRESVNDMLLVSFLALIFLIQIPAFGLWMLMLLVTGSAGTWAGAIIHGVVMAGVCLAFVAARKDLAKRPA
ncbi:hypothetical protein [Paenibacillus soyae]|uniref:Uncharacterized protein n=1 Tax=Paenibacillus soyae TaxID=2969249 RepID=A0A9X2MNA3_9BACL|nr:hypothetical protein [Paenibacillus soyae]MCR2803219.1 hypothetical protein [Paenibacillus soyae]